MIDFKSSTAEKAEDGAIVIAVFDGDSKPVVVLRCSASAAVALLVNISLALAERNGVVP